MDKFPRNSLPFSGRDLEPGGGYSEENKSSDGPFNIASTKHAPLDHLRRWRSATLALNASRRFRYTCDLKKEEQTTKILQEIRTNAPLQVAKFGQARGQQEISKMPIPSGDFGICQEELAVLTRDHDVSTLEEYGGVKGLARLLKTDSDKGINEDDADLLARKNTYGSNTYPRKKERSFWMLLWEAWKNPLLIILIIAAVASLVLDVKTKGIKEGWYNGGSIAFAVILTVLVTAISDYRQSLQFQSLNEEKRNIHLEVVRGGRRVKISINDVVVGDVVPLNIGDQVPADGVLISGHSLRIDAFSMAEDKKIVHMDAKDPFLMSGRKVADGYGTMLVTCVGINTEWGLLMASISEDTGEETPLQVWLNGVATVIGVVGLSVSVVVLVILLARYFTGHLKNQDGTVQFKAGRTSVCDALDGVLKIVTVGVTTAVVAVPEGLPIAVTLILAYSMRKMLADKALVRRFSACETMGFVTTICCDKTVLTLNQMTVVESSACGPKVDCPDRNSQLSTSLTSLLIEGISQNSNGSVYVPETGGDVEVSGSPTEKAILQWGIKLGMNFESVRSRSSIIHVFPFNCEKKRCGVAVKLPDSEVRIHWKGDAEIVLASCTKYVDANDQVVVMDEDKEMYFRKTIEEMAACSLCCVAIAYRPYDIKDIPLDKEQLAKWALPEDELILLAIVGIKDPCRPGVTDAVKLCQNALVKVRMVTGDNLQTAKAIALECKILDPEEDATAPNLIEGKAFRSLTDAQREEVAEKISVMARSSPTDKLLLVQALRKRGHVVAVTADGTNDVSPLHEADIGLAMGIQGTEVAKESSDIIILDDNFASVVKVVRWGRSVYANIKKSIQFQLTVNLAALIINAVAAFSSGDVPLNAVQLLWVNIIADILGALALATEPPTDDLMHRPPVGRRGPLFTKSLCINIAKHVFYQVDVLLLLKFQGRKMLGLQHDTSDHANKVQDTVIFNAFVFCQILNEFYARESDKFNVFKRITKNHLFMGMVILTLILQVIIIEFLGKFTSTVRLNWKQWIISIIIPLGSWPLDGLQKCFGW
ncbi:hypothetical protein ACJRO7_013254 [Eucalyptus globulus]|uniref:Calcium-transporting ATPase n=1 Tax=Eucalyptus globulus TaxID=34317 RepID=A0ABD3KW71_EUCGL